jgi:spermidine dehydrogenase
VTEKANFTRRDFLNGVALSLAAGTTLSPLEILAQQQVGVPASNYPPLLTGLRGAHAGSFEIAHAMAMAGAKFGHPVEQTDTTYDLVVVGGGISGLSAAHLFRQQMGADKKVLILDNHDDFGGHAKRNEFEIGGRTLISYGGSESLEAPGMYSREAAALIRNIGIETDRFYKYFDGDFSSERSLKSAMYFSHEAYGKDVTATDAMGGWGSPLPPGERREALARYPISELAKASFVSLLESDQDYLDGRSHSEKVELLRNTSYTDYLRDYAHVDDDVIAILRDTFRSYWGMGWDAISALSAYRYERPGTQGLGINLPKDKLWSSEEPYIFHFPDGNAGVARALVRQLIPDAVPGSSMEDLVTSRVDYSLLDQRGGNARIRLNSTAIDVRHVPDQSAVDVTYIQGGQPHRVRGRHVILACYNSVIPHITPELPPAQREAIEYAVKLPLVYINVAVRNWRAMAELGFDHFYVPQTTLMHSFGLEYPVSMGRYSFTSSPDQPAVLHGIYVPTTPDQGLDQKQQCRLGRKRLLEMSYADFEAAALRQLDGALAGGGFDVERDVAAITVNRWPHGYAYEYNDLIEPPEYGPDNGPHILGRSRMGRISIANSDASAYAYVNGAIDAAVRAVNEQVNL